MAALTNRYEDDDASHLPPGMKRVGYDADTERYTFREGDDLWLGEPGSFYGGHLKWAGKAPKEENKRYTKNKMTKYVHGGEYKTSVKPLREHARGAVHNSSNELPREFDDNPWGVPAASMSDTGAPPPDSPREDNKVQVGTKKLKRAATLTVNALGIFNRRLRKGTP